MPPRSAPEPSAISLGADSLTLLHVVAQFARQDVSPSLFGDELVRVISILLAPSQIRIWQGSDADKLIEIGSAQQPASQFEGPHKRGPQRERLAAVLTSRTYLMSECHDDLSTSASPGVRAAEFGWVLTPIAGIKTIHGVIYCEWDHPKHASAQGALLLQSIADLVLPYFERSSVDGAPQDRDFNLRFRDFCGEIHEDPALNTTLATIANEYQKLFQSDRTWVLISKWTRWEVGAVGCIPAFQRRSAVVKKLLKLVGLVARRTPPFRWDTGDVTSNLSPMVRTALDSYIDETHLCGLRVEPLIPVNLNGASKAPRTGSPIGLIVCEWFKPAQSVIPESQWEVARDHAAIAIQNALDWSKAPIANLLRGHRRSRSWFSILKGTSILVLISVALTFLGLYPVEYSVDAMGELQPSLRRHIFAKTQGVIQNVAVTSGSEVAAGALLLELENPELELEIRRCEGDLLTTEKRISSVEASRLDFGGSGSSNESVSQINSLAGELKEQYQRRDNLTRELTLLTQRRDELRVISPISGRVVTWDVERLLFRRPVTRGQKMMTVSDSSGDWEVEIHVADSDVGDLKQFWLEKTSLPLEFIVVALPGRQYATTLKAFSNTVEVRTAGGPPTLLCTAQVPPEVKNIAVEGMSVRGRILCGRRPAFVVAFSKFWRIVREHILFPLGW